MSIILFFCVIGICAIPVFIIRSWATEAAFAGRSKSYVKKAKKSISVWEKISLLYLLEESSKATVKRRVVCYWLFSLVVLIDAGIFFLIGMEVIPNSKAIVFYFPLLLLDTIIWLLWRIYKKPKRNTGR